MRDFYQSLKDTSRVMPEVCVYIDDDDIPETLATIKDLGIKYIQGPRHTLSQCCNEAAVLATGSILMYCGDDYRFREKDWDVKVITEFNKSKDKIIFVYGDDGKCGRRLGTCGFIHRRWVDTVGYFNPPYFSSWCIDGWINDIAESLGRRVYLDFVLAEHLHPMNGTAEMDSTYEFGYPLHDLNMQILNDPEHVAIRQADAEKLRKLLGA
jgi:glycosyltransferase involved in cell wall biosynthesis